MAAMAASPGADAPADPARDRQPPATGRALPPALQRFTDQRQTVIAEIHVGLVDEDGRRAEAAARDHFIGIGLELLLDRLLGDSGEEVFGLDANTPADVSQHRVLRDILVLAPI